VTAQPELPGTPYALNNDKPTALHILDCLSAICDPFTVLRLSEAGVPGGGSCLELGAGNGSVAGWLADRVGPAGRVLATDVKPAHIRPHERVTVLEHNLAHRSAAAWSSRSGARSAAGW
jgi:hypothetical protein